MLTQTFAFILIVTALFKITDNYSRIWFFTFITLSFILFLITKVIFDFFYEKINLDEAIAKIKQHTRHYAKRQMTWIRRKESNALRINPTVSDEELVSILPETLA